MIKITKKNRISKARFHWFSPCKVNMTIYNSLIVKLTQHFLMKKNSYL